MKPKDNFWDQYCTINEWFKKCQIYSVSAKLGYGTCLLLVDIFDLWLTHWIRFFIILLCLSSMFFCWNIHVRDKMNLLYMLIVGLYRISGRILTIWYPVFCYISGCTGYPVGYWLSNKLAIRYTPSSLTKQIILRHPLPNLSSSFLKVLQSVRVLPHS